VGRFEDRSCIKIEGGKLRRWEDLKIEDGKMGS
jgi:hypothetical protein